jgi:hypothetical protein
MIAPGDLEGLASQASLGQSMPEEVCQGTSRSATLYRGSLTPEPEPQT